jgi:hypothetical protein
VVMVEEGGSIDSIGAARVRADHSRFCRGIGRIVIALVMFTRGVADSGVGDFDSRDRISMRG